VDVDVIGWVGVGLGGTYGCRCSILYAPMLGVVFYATSTPNYLIIHIHTELPTNPLTSHQISLTIARRMMVRSQHHHAV